MPAECSGTRASVEAEAYCLFLVEALGTAAEGLDFEAAFEGGGAGSSWVEDARERAEILAYFCACVDANIPDKETFYRCLALFQARSRLLGAALDTPALQLLLAASGRVVSSLFMEACFHSEDWCTFCSCRELAAHFPAFERRFLEALDYNLSASKAEVESSLRSEITRVQERRRVAREALQRAPGHGLERDSERECAGAEARASAPQAPRRHEGTAKPRRSRGPQRALCKPEES